MRKRLAAVVGLAAAVVVGGAVFAAPASAGPNCASGNHCVFYTDINSAKHSYFYSDPNFSGDLFSDGAPVNNNVWSASNSTTGGYESHYYDSADYVGFLFCVNPGHYVNSNYGNGDDPNVNGAGLKYELRDRASSLRLRGTTSIDCY